MFPLYVIFVSGTLGSAHYGSDLFWTIAFGLSRKNLVHGISRVLLEISSIFWLWSATGAWRWWGPRLGGRRTKCSGKQGERGYCPTPGGSTLLHTSPHCSTHCTDLHLTQKYFFFHFKSFGAKKASGFFQIKCGPQPTPRVILNILTLTTTSIPWRHNTLHLQCGWWWSVVHHGILWYHDAPWCPVDHYGTTVQCSPHEDVA